jgi:hypothetical protein
MHRFGKNFKGIKEIVALWEGGKQDEQERR